MPVVFVFILLLLGISAMNVEGNQSAAQARNDLKANAVAGQMVWYHMQAVEQCSGKQPCAPGTITVPATSLPPGNPTVYTTNFQSVTDGTTVVTVLKSKAPINLPPLQLSGLVAANLSELSGNSAAAGSWNSSTATVGGSTGQNGIVYSQPTPVASNFEGLSLYNGEPVIATSLK